MMRFSRRRYSLSFPSTAVKTALNANHAHAFLPHSAVPAHLKPQEVQMQNASASKMDESWSDCTSIRLTDSLRSQVKGDAGKCGSLFFSNPMGVKPVCSSSCWSLSSASCIIEMQQTPSSCTAFTSNELSLLELWMLFSFFFSQVLQLPSLYFWKWMTQELWGFKQDETPDFPSNEPY